MTNIIAIGKVFSIFACAITTVEVFRVVTSLIRRAKCVRYPVAASAMTAGKAV
jgi:hypothetical protein